MFEEQQIIKSIINIAKENINNDAIGRYQGWGLIYNGSEWEWLMVDYREKKKILASHGVDVMRWSSLSYDSDDENDFAVKYLADVEA